MVDTELFVTTSRLGYQEKKEQNSKTVGFLPSGTRLAVRQRESVPTLPPVDRFQVAVPFSPDTLGWINADKGGKPTLEPVPEDPPALVEQMAPAPEAGAWSWLSGIGDVVAKLGASVAGSMALFRVFSHSGLDQSDAGLEAAFKEVDADGGGSISREELRGYVAKIYGAQTLDEAVVDAMMSAADSDNNGEVDLEEFKVFMRATASQEMAC